MKVFMKSYKNEMYTHREWESIPKLLMLDLKEALPLFLFHSIILYPSPSSSENI